MRLQHQFVEYIPEDIEEGIMYISLLFGTVVHKCACGCGEEVVTPLGPTEWNFTYNGKAISLYPSIGNWSFDCKSHYWIDEGEVQWARSFTVEEVLEGRRKTKEYRKRYYSHAETKNLKISPKKNEEEKRCYREFDRVLEESRKK